MKTLLIALSLLLACTAASAQSPQGMAQKDARIRELEATIAKQEARIKQLESKLTPSTTQVRLANGGLTGKNFPPNAVCEWCKVGLFIGDIKNYDLSGGERKMVTCPKCGESIDPFDARDYYEKLRKAAIRRQQQY